MGNPGIIVFQKNIGERVEEGEVIARIINPLPAEHEPATVEVASRTGGLLFARSVDRFARPGRIIAKIAGTRPLCKDEGNLLTL